MNNIEVGSLKEKFQKNIVFFLLGRITSELGTSIFKFTLSLYILDITGSVSMFSTILAIGMLPSIFVNIFASVYIDQNNKKKIMIICDLISALSMFVFLIFFTRYPNSIAIFIVYSLVLSTVQSIFSVTIYSSIPNFFDKSDVMKVNSNYQSIGAVVNILGPILGGILYRLIGFKVIIIIEAVTFLLSTCFELYLTYQSNTTKEDKKYFEKFKNTYVYIAKEKLIFYLFLIVITVNFVFIPLTTIVLPYYGYKVMMVSSTELGIIQGIWSIGIIVGALIASIKTVQSKISNKLFVFLQIQGIAIMLWLIPLWIKANTDYQLLSIIVLGIIIAVGGALNSIINIPMLTYLQVYVPENLRASIYGVVTTCIMIAAPIGTWLYGFLIEKGNINYCIIFSSIVIIITSSLANTSKGLREFFSKEIK